MVNQCLRFLATGITALTRACEFINKIQIISSEMVSPNQGTISAPSGQDLIGSSAEQGSGSLGKWGCQENLKYVIFLQKNKAKFNCRIKQRRRQLFRQMAVFIGSRNATQCRTHHQKYESKFGSSKNIVEIYKKQMGAEKFKESYKKMLQDSLNRQGVARSQVLSEKQVSILTLGKQKVEAAVQTVAPTDENCPAVIPGPFFAGQFLPLIFINYLWP